MSRRLRVNLALAVVVMMLGGTAWLLEHRGDGGGDAVFWMAPLTRDAVRTVEIARPGRDTIRLERRDSGWHMVWPFQLPADAAQVSRVLELLAEKSVKRLDAAERERAKFGLAPPRLSLTFDGRTLLVGDPHPYNLQRYVETDNGIYLAGDRFSQLFTAPAARFASRELVPPGGEIRATETPTWRIYRDQDRWRIDPGDERLSADRITAKVDAWRLAAATEIRGWSGGAQGTPVRLELAGSDTGLQFDLVQRENSGILVRRDIGVAYELPAAASLLEYPGLPQGAP